MSQTPNSAGENASEQADQASADLGTMLMQGRSFSGNERNCCFLNTGRSPNATGRFANISAVSGLDFPDDGRAVAVVDWDCDGDLDLWISNRNAPRLRYMRNDTPSDHQFLTLRLEANGTTTNRDAIGARVEIMHKDQSGKSTFKTLRAGEGFLAQSSKWLHFGLGSVSEIEKVVVHWPGKEADDVEEFVGMDVNQRYRLIQGRGTPISHDSQPRQMAVSPSVQPVLPRDETARIRLATLLPMPVLDFTGQTGTAPVTIGDGKPMLLTLWASWCTPCLRELEEFTRRADEIQSAGINVVALSVDKPVDRQTADALLKKMKFPFSTASALEKLVLLLQLYYDMVTGQELPMPLPVSFLVDGKGRLAAIYKGSIQIDALISDVAFSPGNRTERWIGSTPLAGRSIEHALIQRVRDDYDITIYLQFGHGVLVRGGLDEAMACFREALEIRPDDPTALNNLAWLLSTHPNDKVRDGIEGFRLVTRLMESCKEPNAIFLDTLAAAQAEVGRFSDAIATARKAYGQAISENQHDLAERIQSRILSYEQGIPFHQPQHPSPAKLPLR